jgi:hypothetical protein
VVRQLSHPILGAYVIGVAAVWLLHWLPRGRWMQWHGPVSIALGLFVVLSQSRGAALALLLTTYRITPARRRDRRTAVIAIGAAAALAVFFAMQSLMLARGVSYRPQIFMASCR